MVFVSGLRVLVVISDSHRLSIVTIVTLVIYGLAIERKWHYLIVLIPGATCFSAVSVFPVVAAINYATDTYKKYPLEIS